MISPVEIHVSSRRRWVHTGFPLVAGATYRIEVPPGQHWWDLYIRYGPEGGVTGPLQRGLADKLRVNRLSEGATRFPAQCSAAR